MNYVRYLSQNRPGPRMGMGHYERLLIHHLIKISDRGAWRFDIMFDGRAAGQALDAQRLESGLHHARFQGFSSERFAKLPWQVTRAVMRLSGGLPRPDMYHALALSYPAPSGRPAIYTIHDLPPARFPDEGVLPEWAKKAAGEAQAIFTPSQFAKNELVELLDLPEARVHVVPNGCEHDLFHPGVAPASVETLATHGLSGRFLLYVGGFTRRKNVPALLNAWSQLAPQYPDLSLALVGPADKLRALAEAAKAPRVIVVGYLERALLPAVMKASVALVIPSVYEGFGLPPLEAMALGVPVVAVRAGAIPEVVEECAVLAADGSPESLAESIRLLLEDADLARRLALSGPGRARRFSWDEHAQRVLDIYRRVLTPGDAMAS